MAFLLLLVTLLQPIDSTVADQYSVVAEESIISIITHRGGIASTLAHNHLVAASDYSAELTGIDGDPESLTFNLSINVAGLEPDGPDIVNRWSGRIEALGLEDNLGIPGEKDRNKIRREMLDDGQLGVENHPVIKAELVEVVQESSTVGDQQFAYVSTIALTIRETRREIRIPTSIEFTPDSLHVEAVGEATFKEFGVEPYSMALGTVRNKNEFDIYLNIVAIRQQSN